MSTDKKAKQDKYEAEIKAKTERLREEMFRQLGKLEERELLWLVDSARKETVASIERGQSELLILITPQIEPIPPRFTGDRQTREEREGKLREHLRSLFRRLEAIDATEELLRHMSAIDFGRSVADYLFRKHEAEKPTVEGERGSAPPAKR